MKQSKYWKIRGIISETICYRLPQKKIQVVTHSHHLDFVV